MSIKKCKYCGNEFEGRENKLYCSDKCKTAYSRKNKNEIASKKQVDKVVKNSTSTFMPNFSKALVSKAGIGVGNIIQQPLNDFTRTLSSATKEFSSEKAYRMRGAMQMISMGAGALVGYIVGNQDNKKTLTEKMTCLGIGGGAGLLLFNIIDLALDPFNSYSEKEVHQECEMLVLDPEQQSPLSLSGHAMQFLDLQGIKIDGEWSEWLGKKLNKDFWIFLHGSPGSGKSHLATQFAGYMAQRYKVLYVLSEEGVTESVKKRINSYPECENVMFIDSKKPDTIIDTINSEQYDIVVLDSLQGINIQTNKGLELVETIRNLDCVTGVVTVNQNTKSGEARGSLDLSHTADVVIDVVNTEDGNIATTTKNRFADTGKSIHIFAK